MLLDIRDLHVWLTLRDRRIHAVRGINLAAERGQTIGIVGESGSGKSMTANALLDLLPPAAERKAGTMRFDGIDLESVSPRRMRSIRGPGIAAIFQDPMTSLNPVYTIGNQMMEVHQHHMREGKAAARERAAFLLDRVGIVNPRLRMAQYPHELSGGLRQRVMIALALMCDPQLLIADEPTSALDVTLQIEILNLLKELQAEFGMAIVMISHDLGVVSSIADRVMVMYAGEVVEEGTADALFSAPRHPYTAALLACLPGAASGDSQRRLHTIKGTVPDLSRSLPGCAFQERCERADENCAHSPIEIDGSALHRFRCRLPLEPGANSGVSA